MRIVRADHLGMCFGVRDAIALALEHAELLRRMSFSPFVVTASSTVRR